MHTLLMPWLMGWGHRVWHALFLRHQPGHFEWDATYTYTYATCACGAQWVEDARL